MEDILVDRSQSAPHLETIVMRALARWQLLQSDQLMTLLTFQITPQHQRYALSQKGYVYYLTPPLIYISMFYTNMFLKVVEMARMWWKNDIYRLPALVHLCIIQSVLPPVFLPDICRTLFQHKLTIACLISALWTPCLLCCYWQVSIHCWKINRYNYLCYHDEYISVTIW